jgi:type IV pilus assembly protein PilB
MKPPIPIEQIKKRLVQENIVAPDRFDALADEAERKDQSLTDLLVSERVVDAAYMNNLIAETLNVALADLGIRGIQQEALTVLPEDIARQRQVIVFQREADGTYDVAMSDPSDLEAIEFLTQRLGVPVKPFLATQDDLRRGFSIYGSQSTADFKKLIEENVQESLRSQSQNAAEAAAQLPIVAIVNNLLSYAISLRASDIHLEILESTILIRYRVDGILYETMRIAKTVHPAIIARIKLLAGLKIDEHYQPQDGRFRYQLGEQAVDIRVAVMPTFYGEKVVMRLLEASQKPLSLEEIGMLPEIAEAVRSNLKKAFGMILVCGPTGCGKTTTLYALMNLLNKPGVNIVTIEDPIEYNMLYANQTQVNPRAGITFADGLRAFLRQDPNIIMVGEIRDKETADIAVQAALTGHLLMSSLHTNDAPTAIPRLFDLGVPPFLVASTLNVVIAQRLVRRICPSCVYSYDAGPELKAIIEEQLSQDVTLKDTAKSIHAPKMLYRGKGCSACGATGYRGRIGIYEVLDVTEKIKHIVSSPAFSLEVLQTEARAAGYRTMFEDGIEKVELGITTIEEVLRVIRE